MVLSKTEPEGEQETMQSLHRNIEKDENSIPQKKGKRNDVDSSRKSTRVQKRKLEEEDMVEKMRYDSLNGMLIGELISIIQGQRKEEAKIYILQRREIVETI
jgi:hypothetical protein